MKDTDEHIFSCPGYSDILQGKFGFNVFWDDKVLNDILTLQDIAKTVLMLIERMENIQKLG